MAPLHLSLHDKCQTVLFYILDRAKTHHERFRRNPADVVRQLIRHRTQVDDLISEIKLMLRKYPKWASGRDIVTELINIVLRLKSYRWKVFQKNEQYNNMVVNKFNECHREFAEILEAIRNLYRPAQN